MKQQDDLLLKISRRAMATDFELLMHRDADSSQVDAAVRALDSVEAIEAELTVYRPDSTVSRLNSMAATKPMKVSALVFDVLSRAIQVSELLNGAFDITAGPLVEIWGFTNRSGKRPTAADVEHALRSVGWKLISLDPEARSVGFLHREVRINLGAIGKGYALDRIAAQLQAAGVEDYLLHGGNSSILARGHADREAQLGWLVGLMHPTRANHRLCGIRLLDQSLATSGNGKQFFHFRGKRYGHVLDPRTGYPAGECQSLTVLSRDATSADALATGLFVESLGGIEKFANSHPDFPVIAVAATERQGDVMVRRFNYDSAED